MNALHRMSRRLMRNDSGVTAIEYAALGALVALAIIGSLTAVGVSFERQFRIIADAFPSVTPSDDDQVTQGSGPAGSAAGTTGGSPGGGGQSDPGIGGSAGTPGGNMSAGNAGTGGGAQGGSGTGGSVIPDGGTVASAGEGQVTSGDGAGGNPGLFVNSDGKPVGDTGNSWSGNSGAGGGSGSSNGRSGAIRTWAGKVGDGTMGVSTAVSSHESEAKTDARATDASRAEQRSATTPRPVQTAARSSENPSSGADGGKVPVGVRNGLDPLPGRDASGAQAEAQSSRWGVVIVVLLVLAAVFAVRRLVQRANAAGAGGGDVRATSGARARREGLAISPIRRTKTR